MKVFVVIEIDDKYRTINRGIYSTRERAEQSIKAMRAANETGYYYIDEDEVQT